MQLNSVLFHAKGGICSYLKKYIYTLRCPLDISVMWHLLLEQLKVKDSRMPSIQRDNILVCELYEVRIFVFFSPLPSLH